MNKEILEAYESPSFLYFLKNLNAELTREESFPPTLIVGHFQRGFKSFQVDRVPESDSTRYWGAIKYFLRGCTVFNHLGFKTTAFRVYAMFQHWPYIFAAYEWDEEEKKAYKVKCSVLDFLPEEVTELFQITGFGYLRSPPVKPEEEIKEPPEVKNLEARPFVRSKYSAAEWKALQTDPDAF